jgi:hypothetical protein
MEQTKTENGIEYTLVGDYYLPNLALPPEEKVIIGRYGRLHLKFIKDNKRGFYTSLLMRGKLNQYLAEVDKTALEHLEQLMKQMAKQQGVTEQLKMTDQMKWVGMMNNIKSCAEQVVFQEVIFV